MCEGVFLSVKLRSKGVKIKAKKWVGGKGMRIKQKVAKIKIEKSGILKGK